MPPDVSESSGCRDRDEQCSDVYPPHHADIIYDVIEGVPHCRLKRRSGSTLAKRRQAVRERRGPVGTWKITKALVNESPPGRTAKDRQEMHSGEDASIPLRPTYLKAAPTQSRRSTMQGSDSQASSQWLKKGLLPVVSKTSTETPRLFDMEVSASGGDLPGKGGASPTTQQLNGQSIPMEGLLASPQPCCQAFFRLGSVQAVTVKATERECGGAVEWEEEDAAEERMERAIREREDKILAQQEVEMMKERMAMLLLGEDAFGGGSKGVCQAVTISNAIQYTAAAVFGEEELKLEALSVERKHIWQREIGWLLGVCDHIVELVPSAHKGVDGSMHEVMLKKQRNDLATMLPALRQLDMMLLETLDVFQENEFWYVRSSSPASSSTTPPISGPPTPRLPPRGLSIDGHICLLRSKEGALQILKAATAINRTVLADMDIPPSYTEKLLKLSGKAVLGDTLYRYISAPSFAANKVHLKMSLTSEMSAAELADRLELASHVWGGRATFCKEAPTFRLRLRHLLVDSEKMVDLKDRCQATLQLMRTVCSGLPQTRLDRARVQFNKDVGLATLEAYSRVIGRTAHLLVSQINDVLLADKAVHAQVWGDISPHITVKSLPSILHSDAPQMAHENCTANPFYSPNPISRNSTLFDLSFDSPLSDISGPLSSGSVPISPLLLPRPAGNPSPPFPSEQKALKSPDHHANSDPPVLLGMSPAQPAEDNDAHAYQPGPELRGSFNCWLQGPCDGGDEINLFGRQGITRSRSVQTFDQVMAAGRRQVAVMADASWHHSAFPGGTSILCGPILAS